MASRKSTEETTRSSIAQPRSPYGCLQVAQSYSDLKSHLRRTIDYLQLYEAPTPESNTGSIDSRLWASGLGATGAAEVVDTCRQSADSMLTEVPTLADRGADRPRARCRPSPGEQQPR